MKKFLLYFSVSILLFSCSGDSSSEFEDGMIVGDYLMTKSEVFMGGELVEEVENETLWQFTKDSVYIHNECYLEARPKKEGYNFKNVWYDIEEKMTVDGDEIMLEITSFEPIEITYKHFFKLVKLTPQQELFRNTKVNWDCVLGQVWNNGSNVNADRLPLSDEDLGFTPLDELDFRTTNAANFKFSADSLYYIQDSVEYVFAVEFLHKLSDMRLHPVSQCNCEDKFVGYHKY